MMMAQEALDFQAFVQKRIGFGKYQILVVLSLIIVQMSDGMQAISISLVTPILKQQLKLTHKQVSTFTSVFYFGVGIGAILSGLHSNAQGRKPALLIGILLQIISGVLLSMKSGFGWLCLWRLLYGCGFGATLAVATIIATECLPLQYRGKALVIINGCNALGKLAGVGLGFALLQGSPKKWQGYMLTSTLPCLLAFVLCYTFIKQSYRFLLAKKSVSSACHIISQIIRINGSSSPLQLQYDQQLAIQQWADWTFRQGASHKDKLWLMLLEEKRTLVFLSLSWFFVNFVTFGELFIVPFVISVNQEGLTKYLWMTLGEIPSLALTYTLIQREGFGRKASLIIFYSLSALFCFLLFFSLDSFTLFMAKMLIKATFQMLYPFSSESYPTKTRSVAFALNSAVGRIGSSIMPFILYPIYLSNSRAPFLFLGFGSLLGAICVWAVKRDTMRKPLDDAEGESDP